MTTSPTWLYDGEPEPPNLDGRLIIGPHSRHQVAARARGLTLRHAAILRARADLLSLALGLLDVPPILVSVRCRCGWAGWLEGDLTGNPDAWLRCPACQGEEDAAPARAGVEDKRGADAARRNEE